MKWEERELLESSSPLKVVSNFLTIQSAQENGLCFVQKESSIIFWFTVHFECQERICQYIVFILLTFPIKLADCIHI